MHLHIDSKAIRRKHHMVGTALYSGMQYRSAIGTSSGSTDAVET